MASKVHSWLSWAPGHCSAFMLSWATWKMTPSPTALCYREGFRDSDGSALGSGELLLEDGKPWLGAQCLAAACTAQPAAGLASERPWAVALTGSLRPLVLFRISPSIPYDTRILPQPWEEHRPEAREAGSPHSFFTWMMRFESPGPPSGSPSAGQI